MTTRRHDGREISTEGAESIVHEPQPLRVGGLVLNDLQLIRGVGAVQERRDDGLLWGPDQPGDRRVQFHQLRVGRLTRAVLAAPQRSGPAVLSRIMGRSSRCEQILARPVGRSRARTRFPERSRGSMSLNSIGYQPQAMLQRCGGTGARQT